ncbi:MAG: nucleotide pyrophosphohydrolase [Lactimicrobium sp.]|jgi:NTP pyrophosphatase (non-canonical NTP hydrolase)|uniref:nucleotide pyrophosphohydrolase n=1 Tax=Lactimicrobium sp. TaxID=2563780 RepID=UPI002F35D68C
MISDQTIKRIIQFTKDRDWDQFHSPENLAKSISIEAGELLECFQWDGGHYDHDAVKEELADVMNYCILLADKLGVDPDQIINEKIDQNEKKYPVEKAKGTSKKYTEL